MTGGRLFLGLFPTCAFFYSTLFFLGPHLLQMESLSHQPMPQPQPPHRPHRILNPLRYSGNSRCHSFDPDELLTFLLFLLEQLAEKCEFCPHPGRQPLPAGALNWGSPQRPKLPRELREAPKDWAWVWVAAEAPDPRPARRNHGLPRLVVYGPRTARLSAGSDPRLSIERSRQVQKEEKTGGG